MSGDCFGAGNSWWGKYTPYEWGVLTQNAWGINWWRLAESEFLRTALDGGPVVRRLSRAGVDEGGMGEALVKLDGRLVLFDETRSARTELYVWRQAAAAVLRLEGETQLYFVTTDEELFSRVQLLAQPLRPCEWEANRVNVLVATHQGLQLHSIAHAGEQFEPDNYAPCVVAAYQRAVRDLATAAPSGRLVIVEGETGTGKTFLLRGLIHSSPKAQFVLLPPSSMPHLASPELMKVLILSRKEATECAPFVLLLEDADSAMVSRMADNMAAIAALLNMTDGMLGRLLDIRIVATTNAKKVELDEALLRPGRLSARIATGLLDREHAVRIYRRLTGKDYPLSCGATPASLAQVYAWAYEDGWRPVAEPDCDVVDPGSGLLRARPFG